MRFGLATRYNRRRRGVDPGRVGPPVTFTCLHHRRVESRLLRRSHRLPEKAASRRPTRGALPNCGAYAHSVSISFVKTSIACLHFLGRTFLSS